ncbi:MAG: GlcG/HbpS family heme-binding protein [Candidatus Rariloculaceae bacterium]
MSFGRLTGFAIALLALTIVPGLSQLQAQETAAARITNAEAKVAVDAAEAEASSNGWNLAFVITDAEGAPIYVRRMDGVPTRNYNIAMNKVNTVITSGMDTPDYVAAVEEGRVEEIEGALPYDGGLILRRGGQVVGAFSASGARGHEDAQTVRTGMAAIGL